ncbi:MAG: hypothetical protein LBO72_05090 [Helicobacteraceae bacterium]|jgi:hypothetical protein|nr:hypothetical protein [Helicobacteraceae bacterium]
MKRLLILADGEVAERYVKRLVDTYTDANLYTIVYYRGAIAESEAIYCRFYRFDPTSFSKLEAIFSKQTSAAYIVMKEPQDATQVYKNLRILSRELMIYALDSGGLDDLPNDDPNLQRVSASELLANRLMALTPNIPVSAQYVGLGIGEITEVKVPFGSAYAYRHINHIAQNKWRIAAIYRGGELVLPFATLMIRPSDNLLLVGQPNILKTVYRAIKIESGQFPAPYGRSLYLLLDISPRRRDKAIAELESALSLHKRLKNRPLYIKAINPDDWQTLQKLQTIKQPDIYIDIAYKPFNLEQSLLKELARHNAGLLMVSDEFFAKKTNRLLALKSQKPIWKLGTNSISQLKSAALLVSANPTLEQISPVLFDLSAQLAIEVELYPSKGDEVGENEVLEHYENLAAIHSRTISVKSAEENAIVTLRQKENLLLFFPFDEAMTQKSMLDFLKLKQAEKMYSFLTEHHQLFIPVL